MARFDKIDSSRYSLLNRFECYLVKGTLSLNDVAKLNNVNREIVLILDCTRGQNSGVIGALNPQKIKISVTGGLNCFHKKKYNKTDYVERTFYSPRNLANIIKAFESIERRIPYSWNKVQKCMFVYKTLAEMMYYKACEEGEYENGIDVGRTLNGLLAKRTTSFGFALIFKEAMERLGIECRFQSISFEHAWNVVKLDGDMYLVDLAWDVCNKSKNRQCIFKYFCTQDSSIFYANKHHDISNDSDEIKYPISSMDVNRLREEYKGIINSFVIYSKEMNHYVNENGEEFDYTLVGNTKGLNTYIVRDGDNIDFYYINVDGDIRRTLTSTLLEVARNSYNHNISRGPLEPGIKTFKKYVRSDGSQFLLFKTDAVLSGDINEYVLIEPAYLNNKKVLRRYRILSESSLIDVNDQKYEYMVANGMLKRERLEKKTKYYNGYVGFISKQYELFYNREFETQELGIQQRM